MKTMAVLLSLIIFPLAVSSARELNLDGCVAVALERNRELKTARNNYNAGRARLTEARSAYYPQIAATAGAARQVTPLSTTFGSAITAFPGFADTLDVTSYSAGLSLQQNIWDFGRTGALTRQAGFSKDITGLQLEKKRQEIIYRTKKAYLGYLQAISVKRIAAANLKDMEVLLSSVKARRKEGLVTSADVLNAASERERLAAELIKAGHNAEISREALINSMGDPESNGLKFAEQKFEAPKDMPLGFKRLEEAHSAALKSRIDFMEMAAKRKSAQAAVAGVRSEWLPQVSARGAYELQDNDFPLDKTGWSANLSVSLPLFNGFASRARLTSAAAALANAQLDSRQAAEAILLDVTTNYYRTIEARDTYGVASSRLTYLARSLSMTQAKFREGLATMTDRIEAQTKKANGEIERVNALYGYHLALIELEYAVGRTK